MLKNDFETLVAFTKACRHDMHEPDEQSIKARIIGDHLDNAFGESIRVEAIEQGYQEFVVILENTATFTHMRINLANLIALARLANV